MTDITSTVGVIKPVRESNSHAQLERIMPAGVAFDSIYLGIKYRSVAEFRAVMAAYEEKVPEMAARGVDLLHPEGAPPFMLEGLDGEKRRIAAWEDRFGIPVFTTGMTQLAAMAALGVRKFVGITPFSGELAKIFNTYFTEAGLDVLSMTTPVPPDESVYDRDAGEIFDLMVNTFRAQPPGADALFVLGSDWPVFDITGEIEAAIGVPVLHPVPVRCWYVQKRLGLNIPVDGHGRLLAEMI